MSEPAPWSLDDLLRADLGRAVVWATPSVRRRVGERLSYDTVESLSAVPRDVETLVVVGGGTLIDEAKAWAHERGAGVRLVAIPSIWGSGAESSPVVVLRCDGRKVIRIDSSFVPHARVCWPELAESVPAHRAREACGDAWAHALEGFFSPLASSELRTELAGLLGRMLRLPLSYDPEWFEVSAAAAAGQARSSVGLVHGIAHVLEEPLRAGQPDVGWGHARLCSVFLRPVMELNRCVSTAPQELLDQHGIEAAAVSKVLERLFDPPSYARALPLLEAHWSAVLRDPCSRTNCTLVRPQHLSHFAEFA